MELILRCSYLLASLNKSKLLNFNNLGDSWMRDYLFRDFSSELNSDSSVSESEV